MPRGRRPNPIKSEVMEYIYVALRQNPRITGTELYGRIEKKWDREAPALRTVQGYLNEMRLRLDRTPETVSPIAKWRPWAKDHSAEDVMYLTRLNFVAEILTGEVLDSYHAEWALRLKGPLNDLDPLSIWAVTREYAERFAFAAVVGEPPSTKDLDTLIALTPWKYDLDHLIDRWYATDEMPMVHWLLEGLPGACDISMLFEIQSRLGLGTDREGRPWSELLEAC